MFNNRAVSLFQIQALESEDVMIRFHSVYEKLNQALDGMPYTDIGISEEVKEQVCLFPPLLVFSGSKFCMNDIEKHC